MCYVITTCCAVQKMDITMRVRGGRVVPVFHPMLGQQCVKSAPFVINASVMCLAEIVAQAYIMMAVEVFLMGCVGIVTLIALGVSTTRNVVANSLEAV